MGPAHANIALDSQCVECDENKEAEDGDSMEEGMEADDKKEGDHNTVGVQAHALEVAVDRRYGGPLAVVDATQHCGRRTQFGPGNDDCFQLL